MLGGYVMARLVVVLLAAVLAGCSSTGQLGPNIQAGPAAYDVVPATRSADAAATDYKIGSLDTLDVTVFQEPDLSKKAIQVDAAGRLALPLVGTVEARGKTAAELSREIELLFGAKYLREPQVTVTVASSVSQKVSVQGEVVEPGIYPLAGPTTLLDVVSMAKGETQIATLDQVVVFRDVRGQRMGAVFDVASIRRGESADPVIQGNDLVVVGYSAARRFWRNLGTIAPILNVFRPVL
jgi:polysaccharide export outer membrane protein